MFPALLLYFILCKTKRYSGEETVTMIVDGLLSDEDDTFSNESHLSSDSLFEYIYSDSSLVIRQKGKSQNGCFKETKHSKSSEKRTFLTS